MEEPQLTVSSSLDLSKYLNILEKAYFDHSISLPHDPSYHEGNRRRNQILQKLQEIDRTLVCEGDNEKISSRVEEALELQLRKYFSSSSTYRVSNFSVKTEEGEISSKTTIVIELVERKMKVLVSSFQFSEIEVRFLTTGKSWL